MGLFRRKKKFISVSEPETRKLDLLDDNFNDENAPVLPDEIKKTETNPTTTTEKGKDDLDEVFFAALDYLTAPERNYLTNIQRGTMDKQKLFGEMTRYFHEEWDFDEKEISIELTKLEKYIWGYYIIEDLINDEHISDIKIYNENNIRVKRYGKRFPGNVKFHNKEDYLRFVDIICSRNRVSLSDIDAIQTFTDIDSNENARLRFNLTSSIINCNRKPVVHIRKIPKKKKTLAELVNNLDINGNPDPMFPAELKPILEWMAEESSGILFTGKGASGKTTLMNAMIDNIPETYSGLVIQENDELFSKHPDMMYQHVIQSRGESKIQYTLKDLAINGLLTDLDYFIIGEIKGEEAAYFMNAAYTGHKCWSSVHGVSSTEAMDKLADYVKYGTDYPKEDILRMLHYMRFVIFMKDYHVEEISEVVGFSNETHDLIYKPVYKRGEFLRDPRKQSSNSCSEV